MYWRPSMLFAANITKKRERESETQILLWFLRKELNTTSIYSCQTD